MKQQRLWVIGFVCLLLAACGGGGGGGGEGGLGGGSSSNQLRVTLDKTSLTFDTFELTSSPSQEVVATLTGNYSGNVYVGATVEGTGLQLPLRLEIGETSGKLYINARDTLAAGQYSGRILALVCSDPACGNPIGGTPIPITYTVNVRSAVAPSLTKAYLLARENETASTPVINVAPAETFTTFAIENTTSWLQVVDVTPTSFRVVAGPRPPGRHTGFVDLTSGPTRRRVFIDFTSAYAPGNAEGLYASPDTMTFNLMPGMTASKPISVAYSGGTPPSTTAAHITPIDGTWLSVTGNNPHTVNVSSAGLAVGQYRGVVHVRALDSVDMIEVVLNVGPTLTSTAVADFTVDSSTSASALSATSTIDYLGDGAGAWTASTTTPWITLTRAAGQTGTALQFGISQTALSGLDNFTSHSGTIRIVSGRTGVNAIDLPVALHKNVAQVTGLGPQLQFSGQALRTIVRGRGFTAAGAGRLRIAGATVVNSTVSDDTTMILETAALSAGGYAVDVRNELALTAPSTTMQVLDPVTQTYAVVPVTVPVRSLFVDPVRSMVYGVRIAQQELARYRDNSGTWQADAVSLPGLYNANLSNDGTRVVLAVAPGRVSYLDADTLTEQSSFDIPGGESIRNPVNLAALQGPLPISNDGRVWLTGVRAGGTDSLRYFDPVTELFQWQPGAFGASFQSASLLAISRNGQQLIVDDPSSFALSPVSILSTSRSFVAQTSLAANCHGAISEHAERVVCGRWIYSGDLQSRLGELTINPTDTSAGWQGTDTVVLSPNGRIAYQFAFHQADFNFNGGTPSAATHQPRVYVYSISSNAEQTVIVSQNLSNFEFDAVDYPSCRTFGGGGCDPRVIAAISPDGRTLYFHGDRRMVVVPIPSVFR